MNSTSSPTTSSTVYSSSGGRVIIDPKLARELDIDSPSTDPNTDDCADCNSVDSLRYCGDGISESCGCLHGMTEIELKYVGEFWNLPQVDLNRLFRFFRDEADGGKFYSTDSLNDPQLVEYIRRLQLNRDLAWLSTSDDEF